jgi:hypothetical protein
MLALLGTAPGSGRAAELEFTAAPTPPGLTEAWFRLHVPVEVAGSPMPLRAVLAVADYEAGREIFTLPAWRTFAAREHCALLLHSLGQDDPRFKLAKGESAVAALEAALAHFANTAARPELAHAPWMLAGLSQSAWQAHALANLRPARTLALLLFHASTSPHAPEEYLHPGTQDVPALLAMAGDESFPIEMLAFARTGAQRGRPWTYLLQPAVPHHRLGPPEFPVLWLGTALAQRLTPDGTLRRIDPATGWRADYAESSPQPNRRRAARAEIFPPGAPPAGRSHAPLLWLPDEATARAWREAVLADPGAAPR